MSRAEDTVFERRSARLRGATAARYAAIVVALGSGIWAAIELSVSRPPAADASVQDSRRAQGVIHHELPAPAPSADRTAREPGSPLANIARLKLDDAIRTPYVVSIDPTALATKDSVRE